MMENDYIFKGFLLQKFHDHLTKYISQMFGLKLNKYDMSNFYSLEVVGRGSESQLQVSKNLNYLT